MPTVGVTSVSFSKNQKLREELSAAMGPVRFNETGRSFNGPELQTFLAGCEAAIVGVETIDQNTLHALPALKCISKYGVGLDNIDLEACRRQAVEIGWSGGVNAYAVAEQTLGMMIALARNILVNTIALKSGHWIKNGGFELRGRKVGLIGLGHVGQEVARLLKPFGVNFYFNDLRELGPLVAEYTAVALSKSELFKTCDIVSLHVPLTTETRHLVNETSFKLMKPTAILINTSRGQVVDQAALKKALKENRIGGAGLDVFTDEPCTDVELLSLNNLLCTPHTGGNSTEAVLAMGRAAIKNLKELVKL